MDYPHCPKRRKLETCDALCVGSNPQIRKLWVKMPGTTKSGKAPITSDSAVTASADDEMDINGAGYKASSSSKLGTTTGDPGTKEPVNGGDYSKSFNEADRP